MFVAKVGFLRSGSVFWGGSLGSSLGFARFGVLTKFLELPSIRFQVPSNEDQETVLKKEGLKGF